MTETSALQLIAKLRGASIQLSVVDGKIRLKAAKGALSDDLKQEISAHKQEIIALLSSDADDEPVLRAVSRDNALPLSYAQQRLWFLDELEPGTPIYNMPFAVSVRGKLDKPALQSALNDLAQQHESLRTVFSATDTEPVQTILDAVELPVNFETIEESEHSSVMKRLRELAADKFDLAHGPLLKLHALNIATDEYVLLLVIHHIVCDLWSMDIFFRDLGRWYEHHTADVAPKPDPLSIQYADYAAWQRELLAGDRLQRDVDYWLRQLDDAPPVLELATDRPRPPEPGYSGKWVSQELPSALSNNLQALAQGSGTTMFMLTFASFAALLHKYTGEQDMVVGTPISGRQRTELEDLIGFFLNTLPLRVAVTADMNFAELLNQVRATALAGYAHQDLPFEKLVEELQPERDMSHTPVFQHMFIWQDSGGSRIRIPGLQAKPATLIGHDTAKFDLTLAMTNTDAGIEAGIEFNTDLFDEKTVERMLQHLQTLLYAVTQNPSIKLDDIDLLDAEERQLLTGQFNANDIEFGDPVCVHTLVEHQMAQSPASTAIIFGTEELSYADLNQRSLSLAAKLQKMGARPGEIIAISCKRSLDLPVAALAVMRTGACYVPIDPGYPDDRIAEMLNDSAAALIVTHSEIQLPDCPAGRIDLDAFDFNAPADDFSAIVAPSEPLYCIYTSGSTGKPKGVQLSHAGLANLLLWQQQHPRLGRAAKTLQFASFSFDVSFQEFFSTWSTGGTLVMVDEELRQDLTALAKFIADQNIERLYLPFAALQPIAEALVSTGTQSSLKDVVVAGEALQVTPEVRDLFNSLHDGALHNQYGPSETHVVTALTLSSAADDWPALPSIGIPVANTQAYILDEQRRPSPVGIPGELYIGGIQVAMGYLNRPKLNSEKFITSPFISGQRLYRTGDRARYLQNGEIEFIGRADEQFKWRGFRIEPGEIEAALMSSPDVNQAIVVLRDDAPGGNRQLVGYVTGIPELDCTKLKLELKELLPDYMIPAVVMMLDTLPLTPSGKVARRRLPAPEYSRVEENPFVAARNPTEATLVKIWQDVLGIDQAGINDDFFELGGHSLMATQLVSRIRDQFTVSLPLKFIFRYPTPAALAETIATLQATLQASRPDDEDDREEFRI